MRRADKYRSFAELAKGEQEGRAFRISVRDIGSHTVIVAPHGGKIEPGTSEIADAVAGGDFSRYLFEGTKRRGNHDLHITSARFDEPTCLALVRGADRVVTVHGEKRAEDAVFLGGLDVQSVSRLREALQRHGFRVLAPDRVHLKGLDPANICNRGRSGAGVQIEIAKGLRRSLFRSLSAAGRRKTRRRFVEFVWAMCEGIGPSERSNNVSGLLRSSEESSSSE